MSDTKHLRLDRCPWCDVAKPKLSATSNPGYSKTGGNFSWLMYQCSSCGQCVLGHYPTGSPQLLSAAYPPQKKSISEDIPSSVRRFLSQAVEITLQPDACIMACNSAIDAMLKEKKYVEETLHVRIAKAVQNNIITEDMMAWVNHVRLESNDSRHADTKSAAPTTEEAEQCLEFAMVLADILFVLPARVTKGKEATEKNTKPTK